MMAGAALSRSTIALLTDGPLQLIMMSHSTMTTWIVGASTQPFLISTHLFVPYLSHQVV